MSEQREDVRSTLPLLGDVDERLLAVLDELTDAEGSPSKRTFSSLLGDHTLSSLLGDRLSVQARGTISRAVRRRARVERADRRRRARQEVGERICFQPLVGSIFGQLFGTCRRAHAEGWIELEGGIGMVSLSWQVPSDRHRPLGVRRRHAQTSTGKKNRRSAAAGLAAVVAACRVRWAERAERKPARAPAPLPKRRGRRAPACEGRELGGAAASHSAACFFSRYLGACRRANAEDAWPI